MRRAPAAAAPPPRRQPAATGTRPLGQPPPGGASRLAASSLPRAGRRRAGRPQSWAAQSWPASLPNSGSWPDLPRCNLRTQTPTSRQLNGLRIRNTGAPSLTVAECGVIGAVLQQHPHYPIPPQQRRPCQRPQPEGVHLCVVVALLAALDDPVRALDVCPAQLQQHRHHLLIPRRDGMVQRRSRAQLRPWCVVGIVLVDGDTAEDQPLHLGNIAALDCVAQRRTAPNLTNRNVEPLRLPDTADRQRSQPASAVARDTRVSWIVMRGRSRRLCCCRASVRTTPGSCRSPPLLPQPTTAWPEPPLRPSRLASPQRSRQRRRKCSRGVVRVLVRSGSARPAHSGSGGRRRGCSRSGGRCDRPT